AVPTNNTTHIRLCTGVLIPSNRIAPVAANAFASLNKLAPGRIDFGVGSGFTGRRAMGLGAVKLADMEDYVRTVMALLREETVEAEIEGAPPDSPLEPGARADQHKGPGRALCRRRGAAGAAGDRAARRPLAHH